MVIPSVPSNRIDAHVSRVRDEWASGGGGGGGQVEITAPLPLPVTPIGIQNVSIANYPDPLQVSIAAANAIVNVRPDSPQLIGGFDLNAANGGNWVQFARFRNRWRGGSSSNHWIFIITNHLNLPGGSLLVRLALQFGSMSMHSTVTIPPDLTTPKMFTFPPPDNAVLPNSVDHLTPAMWTEAYFEARVTGGGSTGDMWLLFSHDVEMF